MSYKPKTRIFVAMPDGERELFSIRERPSGELQILLRSSINHEDPTKGDAKMISEKISVHPSDLASGTTIIRKNPLEGGRLLSSASFVIDSEIDLLFTVFGQSLPKFISAQFSLKRNDRDSLVEIPAPDEPTETLVTFACVASAGTKFQCSEASGLSLVTVHFCKYALLIFYAYLQTPTINGCDMMFTATSPEQDTPTPAKPDSGGAYSLLPEELEQQLHHLMRQMCKRTYERRVKLFEQYEAEAFGSLNLNALRGQCYMVTNLPFKQLEQLQGQLPVIFSSSLPLSDLPKCVIISVKGKPCGKIFLD